MRILVTGAAGFIGGAVARILAQELTADDDDLVCTDVRSPTRTVSEVKGVDWGDAFFVNADLSDRAYYSQFSFPYDAVVHCAGILGTETTFKAITAAEQVNIRGTLLVLEAQRGHLVIQPNLLGDWLNPYMISKNAAEQYGLMYRKYLDTPYVSVRLTDVYGPGQATDQKKITPTFIIRALAGDPLFIYGDGSYKVRLLYVDDAAAVLARMAMAKAGHMEKVDITSLQDSNFISVLDYARWIIGLTDSKSEIGYVEMRKGQPRDYPYAEPDLACAGRWFDYAGITETPLLEGLRKTIEYYKELDKPEWGINKSHGPSAIGNWMDRGKV